MAIFTVHVPSGVGDPRKRADRTVFVREGFSTAALFFGPVFLLYRRLWLPALGWIATAALLAFMAHALELSFWAVAALFLLLALFTGFEASSLRQYVLTRRGFLFAGLLASPSREAAERSFFMGGGASGLPASMSEARREGVGPRPGGPGEVIGSFEAGDSM